MKKITLLLGFLVLILTACNGEFGSNKVSIPTLFSSLSPSSILGFVFNSESNKKAKETPETLIVSFVEYTSSGNCDKAKDITTGNALETIQAIIDAGCEPYKTEILGVKCDVISDVADCTCDEKREGLDMTYKFHLIKVKKDWKIESYEKDLDFLNEN